MKRLHKIKFLKGLLALAFMITGIHNLDAQMISQPFTWTAKAVAVHGDVKDLQDGQSGKNSQLYEIEIEGISNPGWHIYDMKEYKDGPIPTAINIPEQKGIRQIGKPYVKSEVNEYYDDQFKMKIGTLSSPVKLGIKILAENTPSAELTISWQACNNKVCMPPDSKDLHVTLPANKTGEIKPVAENIPGRSKSLWSIILEAILWGFVALLTPCVFPMVPMTVSFFLKNSGKSKAKGRLFASIYGLSIIFLFTVPIAIIILITYIVGGGTVTADIFNWLATHWIPNILFFLIFMIFAASFFGAFEITLPGWMVNKSDKKSDRGGFIGVFFMALTLVLVSFSCTGPIVGSVLIKSTQGAIWEPIIVMFAFSVAFSLPFTVLAFVPSLLKDLPKSGGWLNSVKVVLGFIELALGLKFLSVADQVYRWGILDREVYIALWIVIFALLGFYLLGKIRFAHDSKTEHVTVKRLFLAIIDFAFVVYMIPGMWGAPLKALSGYLPPIESMDFNLSAVQPLPSSGALSVSGTGRQSTAPADPELSGDGSEVSEMGLKHPLGLHGFFDYGKALEYASESGKPLFIDFTGAACVNCREMEAKVLSDKRIMDLLNEKFVFVSLYGDVKARVNKKDFVTLPDGKVLKALGKINTNLVMTRYQVNAMPSYIITDGKGKTLIPPRGYNLNREDFIDFLKKGLDAYGKML